MGEDIEPDEELDWWLAFLYASRHAPEAYQSWQPPEDE